MGIRIHKVLGYGLQDVKCSEYRIQDERFSDKFLEDILYGCYDRFEEFNQWVLGNTDEAQKICDEFNGYSHGDGFIKLLQREIKENMIHKHIFIHDGDDGGGDDGLDNIFLICPLEYQDWYRYDDIIDYYTDDCGSNLDSLVREIECGIFPYIGLVKIPGIPVFEREIPHSFNPLVPSDYQMLTGRWDKGESAFDQELADYLLKAYRPIIPCSVILLCHYFKLFKDLNTVQELRPLLYTFWN